MVSKRSKESPEELPGVVSGETECVPRSLEEEVSEAESVDEEGMVNGPRESDAGEDGLSKEEESPCQGSANLESAICQVVPVDHQLEKSEQTTERAGGSCEELNPDQAHIVEVLLRRARYLLTLKGRPPFRLAGVEMYEGLSELTDELESFIGHHAEPRLVRLHQGLKTALENVLEEYCPVRQGGTWLRDISDILDTEGNPVRSGEQVKQQLFDYLAKMHQQATDHPVAAQFVEKMEKTTRNYEKGLFHTYDVESLPRTNNDRESEFRDYKRHLLRTTGQIGTTRRLIGRSGAWEILGTPESWEETAEEISQVNQEEFCEERERVRQHRGRFQLHTRSVKFVRAQLEKLKKLWFSFAPKPAHA